MGRLSKEKLDSLMKQEGVSRIWSWSRINCFHNSSYEYYLKYIKHAKEDNATSIYAPCGGIVHSILENYYTKQIPYSKMIDDFEDGWITTFDIAQLKFDRANENHNDKLAIEYKECLEHFFKNHKPIEYNIQIEQFIKSKIGGSLFGGYIDACYRNSDGVYHIVDFKTSSIYTGKKAENECGQLIIYAIGLNQAGIKMGDIRICWNFLKYCTVEYVQTNGKVKSRNIKRNQIGESLQSNIRSQMKKRGYSELEIDRCLMSLIDSNSINCLPDDIKDIYTVSDCYVYVDITDELVRKWTDYITNTITDIELREKDYADTYSDSYFWDSEESVKKQSYYFANLCSFSANLHKPYAEYLQKLEANKNGLDIFSGVGNKLGNTIQENKNKNRVDSSLEWLNDIL